MVTATTTASLGAPSITTLRVAIRFRCASAVLSRMDRRPRRSGCATAPWAGLVDRRVGCQLFEPHLVVMVQATFVVVDEHASSNVLRIYKGQSPLWYATLLPLMA